MQPDTTQATSSVVTISRATAAGDFNSGLRNYACAKADWGLREKAAQLYGWADRFNSHFGLNLTTPAIGIDRLPARTLGTYRPANGLGIDDEVVINVRWLHRSAADVMRTLLHEMLHQWQHHYGQPSTGAYHNDEFQAKARELGIPCNAKGHNLGTVAGSPLHRLLGAHGIQADTCIKEAGGALAGPGSKLKKWSCGCTNVRCAVELQALCERCGKRFVRVVRLTAPNP